MKKNFVKSMVVAAAVIGIFAGCEKKNSSNGSSSGNSNSNNNLSYIIITTPAELAQLATSVNKGDTARNNKNYKLGNDIDLSQYQEDNGWIPIGIDMDNAFKGIFDGDNKKITGLYIYNTDRIDVGLFGYISNAVVKNINIIDANVTSLASSSVGGIVGKSYNSEISNCSFTGSVENISSSHSYLSSIWAGGVVGSTGSNCTVSNCYSSGTVSANTSSSGQAGGGSATTTAGGVVGNNGGNISNCYSTSDVSAKDYAGGVVGSNSNKVSNCYSTGSISVYNYYWSVVAGGIVGQNYTDGNISNCYSTAKISAYSVYSEAYAGGIVGSNGVAIIKDKGGSVQNCVALNPNIDGIDSYTGRIMGDNVGGTINNNVAFDNILNSDGETTWHNKGTNNKDGADISAQSINTEGTFGGRFTTTNAWTIQNGKLPGLFGNAIDMPKHLK